MALRLDRPLGGRVLRDVAQQGKLVTRSTGALSATGPTDGTTLTAGGP